MIEMQIEGNMVSDDDGEGDSEEEIAVKGRHQSIRGRTESAISKKRMRAQSKTIIEMVDDDVSSDEFLDNPGSLPRNSFGYD